MILHNVNSNSSWMEALKNNTGSKIILVQAQALERMRKASIVPKHQILDFQKSAAYEEAIRASGMTFELVPPDDHRRNMAEETIQTLKDHFVGILSGCAPTFSLHLWCQLLPRVERQLLLLCQSRLHPNLSAYAQVYGHQDYNRHLFIPIGMEALVHNKPHKHCTFTEHCKKAFVLGTFPDHYQCWKFWSTMTRATQILGAAFFKHKYLSNLSATPKDLVIAAAANLAKALETTISIDLRNSSMQALTDLSALFSEAALHYNNDPDTHVIAPETVPKQP
jgi:hypothetical protein